ncbi:hypothetical protein [Paenibacillus mucilaginosus]|uniref:Lipoprotein n=2 Tax=Paenibacillus mucilaginosus TaxID=61624 RepID=H6NK89_9BACL|nr:hypothetical protein [Paenibacillus mucilaginosus]AEI43991.1 hypothetical protein KNP414_05467 [Paenibacillus mucilaginosus KNP414]AFC31573.1 hypothetical protein PM3016_4837 [Paenibacillus mucilaginosus 3016]MCG7212517.1 hypothetical protein [Paenibacillus mucilaginosus]WDM25451.1 hypothetical protein KCX80_23715 [Paenibacillus mucilaginosus]WFA20110.1 hypothetical protein ERY13_24165 [Paenibacillus mucilaginosus]
MRNPLGSTAAKGALAAMLLGAALTGCEDPQTEMQQERQEDLLDEREDRTLQNPVREMRNERMEERLDEMEDRR